MIDLLKHGTTIRTLQGTGEIILEDETRLACEFSFVQYTNSQMRLACDLTEDANVNPKSIQLGNALWAEPTPNIRFEGRSDEAALHVQRSYYRGNNYGDSVSPAKPFLIFSVQQAEITALDLVDTEDIHRHPKVHHANFHLLNFEFPDFLMETTQADNHLGIEQEHIWLDVFNKAIVLKPVDNYDSIIQGLSATNEAGVTAEAVTIFSAGETTKGVRRQMINLSGVLSLLQGTRVNWIGYDLVSRSGQVLYSYVYGAASSRFKPNNSIFNDRTTRQPTASFLKRAIEPMCHHFAQADRDWKIYKAINQFNDARIEKSFIEFRGLKLVGCIEAVRHHYLNRVDREFIVSPSSRFDDSFNEKGNKRVLQWFLTKILSDLNDDHTNMLMSNAKSMNRYPFRRALREMCQEIGFYGSNNKEAEKSIESFVAVRNSLVHRGDFLLADDADEDMEDETVQEAVKDVRVMQYRFLRQFVGFFLLSVLKCPHHPEVFPGTPPQLRQNLTPSDNPS
jgi:hypothetical protein